ncbi:histidine phosphatase family protein [bacterium]|nr:MAG: histidine phosphatase family protein [bacterium]
MKPNRKKKANLNTIHEIDEGSVLLSLFFMKIVLLQRHAKSDWSNAGLDDHDRPLNERGKKDAPLMAKFLVKQEVKPEIIISSTAVRAQETAMQHVKSGLIKAKQLHERKELYQFDGSTYPDVLSKLSDEYETAMLVGHNPSIEILAGLLVGTYSFPLRANTASIHLFELTIDSWADLKSGCGQLQWSVGPRLLKAYK